MCWVWYVRKWLLMPSNTYLALEFKLEGERSEDRRGMMDGGSKDWWFQWHLEIDSAGLLDQLSRNYGRKDHQILWLNWDLGGWVIFGDHGIAMGLNGFGWILYNIDVKKHRKLRD